MNACDNLLGKIKINGIWARHITTGDGPIGSRRLADRVGSPLRRRTRTSRGPAATTVVHRFAVRPQSACT